MKNHCKKRIALVCCVLITALFCALFCACNEDVDIDDMFPSHNSSSQYQKATSFATLNLGANVELVLDQDNRVLCATGVNQDGQLLLWNESGIIDVTVSVAVKKIVALALQYGFLNQEYNHICFGVASDENKSSLQESIKTAINTALSHSSVDVVVCNDTNLVLQKELDVIKAQDDEHKGLDITHYALVKRAMSCDTSLTIDNALKSSVANLASIVQTSQSNATTKLGQSFAFAQQEAGFVYTTSKQYIVNSLFLKNFESAFEQDGVGDEYDNANKALNATIYNVAHTAQLVLAQYKYVLESRLQNPIYSQSDAQTIYSALIAMTGQSFEQFVAGITDANGNITLEKINEYINKAYLNLDDDKKALFESKYDSLKIAVLDNAVIDDDFSSGVETSLAQLVQNASQSFPQQMANHLRDDVAHTLQNIVPGGINFKSVASVQSAIVELGYTSTDAYTEMFLSQEDLDNVQLLMQSVEQDIKQLKANLNDAIALAKNDAIDALNLLKSQLSNTLQSQENIA